MELVERGILDGPEAEELVEHHVRPMLDSGADHIVLGCTHYPFLTGTIEKIVGGRAVIVNPAPAVALQAQRVFGSLGKAPGVKGKTVFFSMGADDILKELVRRIAGDDIETSYYSCCLPASSSDPAGKLI